MKSPFTPVRPAVFYYLPQLTGLFDVDNLQGQSADPPAEGPEAAIPWF